MQRAPLLLAFVAGGLAGVVSWMTLPALLNEARILPVAGLAPTRTVEDVPPDVESAPTEPRAEARERAAREQLAPTEIARRSLSHTVYVETPETYGAGVLLDERGYVLTCLHVVRSEAEIDVTFADGQVRKGRVIDSDADLDLAILDIGAPPEGAVPAERGSVSDLVIGEELFAMGAPREMRFSLSRGMVGYVGRRFGKVHYLQSDLPMNGGSSGGPVFDAEGRVVGVGAFVLKESEGLSFALPIDYAYRRFGSILGEAGEAVAFQQWLNQVKAPGAAARLMLGASLASGD